MSLLGRLVGTSLGQESAKSSEAEERDELTVTDQDLTGDYNFGELTLRELVSEAATARGSNRHSFRTQEDCMLYAPPVLAFGLIFLCLIDTVQSLSQARLAG